MNNSSLKTNNEQAEPLKENRDYYIRARVKTCFKEDVDSVADACGMDESAFVLARSFGFEPRLKLSEEEVKLMDVVTRCRIDLDNFGAAFKKADNNVRSLMIKNLGEEKLKRWLATNAAVATSLRGFFDDICKSDAILNNKVVYIKYSCRQSFDYEKALQSYAPVPVVYLPDGRKKRDPEIKSRVTAWQKRQFVVLCAKLGVRESDILRSRCIGYQPQPRLSDIQKQWLVHLDSSRDLIKKFSKAKRMMTPAEQERIYHDYFQMLTWMTAVERVSTACKTLLRECVGIKKTRNRKAIYEPKDNVHA